MIHITAICCRGMSRHSWHDRNPLDKPRIPAIVVVVPAIYIGWDQFAERFLNDNEDPNGNSKNSD